MKPMVFKAGWMALLGLSLAYACPVLAEETVDMAEMMKRAQRFTQPGPAHEFLNRFVGTWDSETKFTMPGQAAKPEKGRMTFRWRMKGRWLEYVGEGTMFGRPLEIFGLLGYDNFKQSYVSSDITTMDTAMHYAEGDLDPSKKALILYGTIDEYLTGEHDKMVRYVWRFIDANTMKFEVHDLPIGEKNTQVIEVVYRRRK